MPFLGHFTAFSGLFLGIAGLWVLLPQDQLSDDGVKSKLKYCTIFELFWFGYALLWQNVLAAIFNNLPHMVQWIFAFIVPVARKFEYLCCWKFVCRIVGKDNEMAHVWLSTRINARVGLYILIRIKDANVSTMICMALMEILLQVWMSYQITQQRMSQEIVPAGEEIVIKKKFIINLVLAELCEGLVPLVYIIGFAMSYFGPNFSLIGNVGSDHWGYTKIEDPNHILVVSFAMFLIDLVALSLNGISLWIYAKINIAKEFCLVLKKYWFIMALSISLPLFLKSFATDINLGIDRTFEFDWITKEGRLQLIQNSTEISREEKLFLLLN